MIKMNNIPVWLHSSELYKNIIKNKNDDQDNISDMVIDIPIINMKPDDSINSFEDIRWMAYTMQYWVLDKIPNSIYEYCISHNVPKQLIIDFEKENPILAKFLWNRLKCFSTESFEEDDIWNSLGVYKFIDKVGVGCTSETFDKELQYTYVAKRAFILGFIDIIDYIYNINPNIIKKTYYLAAQYARMDCLEYVKSKQISLLEIKYITQYAIFGNQLDTLKYLVEKNQCPINNDWSVIITKHNNQNMLEYIYSIQNKFPTDFVASCCREGCSNMFFYAIRRGVAFSPFEVVCELIHYGHVDFLKQILEDEQIIIQSNNLSFKNNPYPLVSAYKKGNREMIDFLHSTGFLVSLKLIMYLSPKIEEMKKAVNYFTKPDDENTIGIEYKSELFLLITNNQFEALEILYSIGYTKLFNSFMKKFIESNNFQNASMEMITYLYEKWNVDPNKIYFHNLMK